MTVNTKERLKHLDWLRGLAVLGLLLMNLPAMGLPELGYVRYEPDLLSDKFFVSLEALLFDGRFRNLFCILFAIGLYIQYTNYAERQLNSSVILKSRLKWLLVFGIIHCVFIWPGDILMMYALGGYYLLSKLDWTADKLLKRGIVFFVIGLFVLLVDIASIEYFRTEPLTRTSDEFIEALTFIKGSYTDTLLLNAFIAFMVAILFPITGLFFIGGVLLIGLGLFKSGKLSKGFTSKELRVLVFITVLVSVIDVYLSIFEPLTDQLLYGLFGTISGLSMALLIWHLVIKLKLAESNSWLSICLQRTGRMALTLYISQSIIMAGVFRYLFPELNETFSLLDYFLTASLFISIQMLLAYHYFKVFNQGPLEYLWRKLVTNVINKEVKAQRENNNLSPQT